MRYRFDTMTDDTTKTVEAGQEANDKESGAGVSPKSRLERTLPTGRVIFTKQLDILKAYPAAYERVRGPVAIEDLKDLVKLAPATISQANPFFCDVGFLQKEGRKFVPSPELEAMLRMSGISQEKAWAKLAPLLERSWCGQLLVPKLRIRPLTEDEIVHDLADAAKAEADHIPQLRIMIEYMVLVGLVSKEGGVYKLVNNGAGAAAEVPAAASPETREVAPAVASDLAEFVFILDPKAKRRVVFQAPHDLTKKEVTRVLKWMNVQFEMDEEPAPTK